MQPTNNKKNLRKFIPYCLAAFFVLVVLGLGTTYLPLVFAPQADAYLERQESALRQPYGSHLQETGNVPRYNITATLNPDSGILRGQLKLDYTNTQNNELTELVFRLYPNADWIYSGGSLTVDTIRLDQQNLDIPDSPDPTVLRLPLPQPLTPQDEITLHIDFRTQVPASGQHNYGILDRALDVVSLSGWYPILTAYRNGWLVPEIPVVGDAMLAETSLYEVSLTIPNGYLLASTGVVLSEQPAQPTPTPSGQTIWRMVSGPVREFALAISRRFETIETQVDGVTLRMFYLPSANPITPPQQGLQIMEDAFEVYTRRFGPYPYTQLEMVEANIWIGGYEFPTLIFLENGLRDSRSFSDYRYLVAHELAHQWFYGLVGNNQIRQPWLDEAHATYGPVLYLEEAISPEAGQRLLDDWLFTYGEHTPSAPPLNSAALEFTNWAEYREAIYIHGAFFLDDLRNRMGDGAFFSMLSNYQQRFRYQIAATQDYLNIAQENAPGDLNLNPFFEEWFELP